MSTPIMERWTLWRKFSEKRSSHTLIEEITRVLVDLRVNQGHEAAEAKAKEIKELIDKGLSEAELLKRIK